MILEHSMLNTKTSTERFFTGSSGHALTEIVILTPGTTELVKREINRPIFGILACNTSIDPSENSLQGSATKF